MNIIKDLADRLDGASYDRIGYEIRDFDFTEIRTEDGEEKTYVVMKLQMYAKKEGEVIADEDVKESLSDLISRLRRYEGEGYDIYFAQRIGNEWKIEVEVIHYEEEAD